MKERVYAHREEDAGIRERILAAAMKVLQDEGIQGLSQVQVARRAKVRQSHLTYYFPKRHDLIEAVAVRFLEGVSAALDEPATGTGSTPPVLQRFAAVIGDPKHVRMFTAVIVEGDGDPKVRAILVRVTRRIQSMIAAELGGDDADDRAEIILGSLWGLALHDFVLRPKRPGALAAAYLASITELRPAQVTSRKRR